MNIKLCRHLGCCLFHRSCLAVVNQTVRWIPSKMCPILQERDIWTLFHVKDDFCRPAVVTMKKGKSISTAEGVLLQGCGNPLHIAQPPRWGSSLRVCPPRSAPHTNQCVTSSSPVTPKNKGLDLMFNHPQQRTKCVWCVNSWSVLFSTTWRHGALLPASVFRAATLQWAQINPARVALMTHAV